jgi:predicted secreted protein
VNLAPGDALVVRLSADPASGEAWEVALNDATVVRRVEEPPNAKPGTGGYQVFEFRVVAPGASSLALVYRRPSEKDQPPARTWGILLAAAGLAGSPS